MKERIYAEQKELEDLASYAVEKSVKSGAEESSVRISKQTGLTVTCRNQELENIQFHKSRVLTIDVCCGGRDGSSFTCDLSHDAIDRVISAAVSIASHTEPDSCNGLPDKENFSDEQKDFDILYPEEPDPDVALKEAQIIEKEALSCDPRVKNSLGAGCQSSYGIEVLANSAGFLRGGASSFYMKKISVLADDKNEKHHGFSYSFSADRSKLWNNSRIVNEAVHDSVSAIGGRKIPTGNYPILFSPQNSSYLIGLFLSAIGGMNQYYKSTCLAGCLGKQVLPSWMTIAEDPFIKGKLSSCDCDSDGVKVSKSEIVKAGIVQHYLLSTYSARKLGMITNGHSGGYSNIFVKDVRPNSGNRSLDDMLKIMDHGVYVKEQMGQGVNLMNGNYSMGVEGFWVENGEIKYPVNEITIAGNIPDIFNHIVAVGSDYDERYSLASGSLLVDEMKVAGI